MRGLKIRRLACHLSIHGHILNHECYIYLIGRCEMRSFHCRQIRLRSFLFGYLRTQEGAQKVITKTNVHRNCVVLKLVHTKCDTIYGILRNIFTFTQMWHNGVHCRMKSTHCRGIFSFQGKLSNVPFKTIKAFWSSYILNEGIWGWFHNLSYQICIGDVREKPLQKISKHGNGITVTRSTWNNILWVPGRLD